MSWPTTVIDVGCGEGFLVDALRSEGIDAIGVDGPWVDGVQHVALDGDLPDLGRFDMATCLEVAEHVPPARAGALVGWLARLAPVVVFSAAVPGQGGEGHVNEQWPGYWADLFAEHGYAGTGDLRWTIWDDARIEWWYRQNLLVFASDRGVLLNIADGPAGPCLPVIHPGMAAHHGLLGQKRAQR